MSDILKSFKVTVEGPLWYDILQIANKKLIHLQEMANNRNFVRDLKPLITLTKALNWESIGSQLLKRVNLVNVVKIHGRGALKQRQVLNTFYRYLTLLKDHSVKSALDLLSLLLTFGDNHLVLDFQHSFFLLSHQLSLNRLSLS